jgi:hypothetical protein
MPLEIAWKAQACKSAITNRDTQVCAAYFQRSHISERNKTVARVYTNLCADGISSAVFCKIYCSYLNQTFTIYYTGF